MSRVLVTGATGFVARAVLRALRADGHALSGTTRRTDLGQGPEGVPLYRVPDFVANVDWSPIVAGAHVVVHLAAHAHAPGNKDDTELALYRGVNRDGSRRLAEAAAAAGVKRFVFMSSVKAAGEESFGRPLREDDPPAPEDAYGISKWEAEQALAEVAARTGLEMVILRPPLVYGSAPRGNLASLLRACDGRWPLPFAGVENRRSLISVRNLAHAVAVAVQHPAAPGRTFFVADDEDLSTPALITRLSGALGRRPRLFRVPKSILNGAQSLPKLGPSLRRLTGSLQIDSQTIRALLGWQPIESTDQGLSEMAAWFKESRSGN